jgi:ABC-type glycerol-3-phosphate transport system substrate-binding protein
MKKLLILVFMLTILLSCTDKSSSNINMRITWKAYSGRGEAIQSIVDDFTPNTDSDVLVLGGNEDIDEIESLLALNEIDLYVLPYRYVQYLGQEHLMALDINLDEKNISRDLQNLARIDDELYGVPWLSHSMALIYNKELVELAGINIEAIVDKTSFIEELKKTEALSVSGIGLVGAEHNDLSWMVNQFLHGQNGQLINNGKLTINSKASADGLKYYFEELTPYAQSSWQEDTGVEVMELFRNGQLVFEIQGPWGITDIWKNGNPFEVGVLPLSTIDLASEVGPMMLCIPNNINKKKIDKSLELIDFLISTQAQEAIMRGEYSPEQDVYYPFRLPVRDDIINSYVFVDFPEFVPFIQSYHNISIDVPEPIWQTVKTDIYTPLLRSLVLEKITISEFLLEIEEKYNDLIEGEINE